MSAAETPRDELLDNAALNYAATQVADRLTAMLDG